MARRRALALIDIGLPLAIWWYVAASQPPLTVRLTLTRADNTGIILLDTRPVHETYPFSRWSAPQFVIDEINIYLRSLQLDP